MAFRDAFRILYSRFSISYKLALFFIIVMALAVSVSLIFILPIIRAFNEVEIFEQTWYAFSYWLSYGDFTLFGTRISYVWTQTVEVFAYNPELGLLSFIMFFIVAVTTRFLLGYFEIPTYMVLEGAMSSNAKFSFSGRFVAGFSLSTRYILTKSLLILWYDALFLTGLYFSFWLFTYPIVAPYAPLIIFLGVVIALALRQTLLAFYGPRTVMHGGNIFKCFAFSLKKAFWHFGRVFGGFLLLWLIILTVNLFFGIFTFGIGLIATIPVSMLLVCIFNMTLYYTRTGKRFYANDKIITPTKRQARGEFTEEEL